MAGVSEQSFNSEWSRWGHGNKNKYLGKTLMSLFTTRNEVKKGLSYMFKPLSGNKHGSVVLS